MGGFFKFLLWFDQHGVGVPLAQLKDSGKFGRLISCFLGWFFNALRAANIVELLYFAIGWLAHCCVEGECALFAN